MYDGVPSCIETWLEGGPDRNFAFLRKTGNQRRLRSDRVTAIGSGAIEIENVRPAVGRFFQNRSETITNALNRTDAIWQIDVHKMPVGFRRNSTTVALIGGAFHVAFFGLPCRDGNCVDRLQRWRAESPD